MYSVRNNPHFHLSSRSLDGAVYANSFFENKADAALSFLAIAKNLMEDRLENEDLTIEMVMQGLTEEGSKGMYVGQPGLILMVSKCEGKCTSPVWN